MGKFNLKETQFSPPRNFPFLPELKIINGATNFFKPEETYA